MDVPTTRFQAFPPNRVHPRRYSVFGLAMVVLVSWCSAQEHDESTQSTEQMEIGQGMADFSGALPESDERDHAFHSPEEPMSLGGEMHVDIERSILANDERLRSRLENALDARVEDELLKFLDMEIGEDYKRRVLLTLGEIYQKQGSTSRLIALYEKFILEFPRDPEVSKLYLKLGRLYREAGVTKTALAKFYNVLNAALSVPVDQLKDYQELSHRAQLEIAETFFEMGSYEQASKFFRRLLRIELVEEDRQNVLFKYAYTIYLAEEFDQAIPSLRSFLQSFPESDLAPEARFILSETYLRLNDPKSALRETLELLNSEVSKIQTNPAAWLYWKKRTGNRLANQFYQEGNFIDALTVYQAMANISDDPAWTWPVLYQIGLCYEKLDMKPKAIESYRRISEEETSLTEQDRADPTLSSIFEMALWRMDRLEMDISMELNLQQVLSNS